MAEVGEPVLQQSEGASYGVGAGEAAVDADDPLVQLLVDGVVVDGGFQRGDGLVGVVGFEDLGDAGVGAQELVAVGGGVVGGPGQSWASPRSPP